MKRGDMSGPKSAQMVLQNPTVDTAVFEVARGGILREGLGYDRNDVAVVTNVTGDHLGLGGIDTLGQLANVKGVLVEAVPRSGSAVLNADDHLVYRMGRHCAGRVVLFSMAKEKGEDGFDRVDGHTSRGNAAFCLEDTPQGELMVLKPRAAQDAGPVHAPHARHVRRPGADERRQRAGRGRRRVGVGRAPPRHPPGPADVHDVVLPGAGPAQPGRGRGHARRHRLLPQRRRHAPAGGLREPDDGRAADAVRRPRGGRPARRRIRRGPGARSASSGSPATGATRTSASTARSPAARSTRSTSARTRTSAGASRARRRPTSRTGSRRRASEGRGRTIEGREGPRRGVRGPGGAAPRRAGRPRGRVRRRRGGRVPGGDDARRARRRAGPRSRTRASSRRPRARPGERPRR